MSSGHSQIPVFPRISPLTMACRILGEFPERGSWTHRHPGIQTHRQPGTKAELGGNPNPQTGSRAQGGAAPLETGIAQGGSTVWIFSAGHTLPHQDCHPRSLGTAWNLLNSRNSQWEPSMTSLCRDRSVLDTAPRHSPVSWAACSGIPALFPPGITGHIPASLSRSHKSSQK